ncbi:MAG: thrombospondin type 3 repeat-containing protein [Planctomycetota bacterium]|jgi:T5SS/PEP-CTERM-associated repeat protein
MSNRGADRPSSPARGLAALVVAGTIASASAGQVTWTGLGDGTSFGDQQNWDLLQVPGATDIVRFSGAGGAIGFAVDPQTAGLLVQDAIVTFMLGGRTYTIAGELNAGSIVPSSSGLTILGGALHVLDDPVLADLVVGDAIGEDGVLTVGAGAALTNDGETIVGDDGTGLLWVRDGGSLSCLAIVKIGDDPGGIGTLRIDGAGSTWDAMRAVAVGDAADGTLELLDGATATTAGTVFVGDEIGSTGAVVVADDGTVWTCAGQLIVGNGDDGSLAVQGGATLTTRELAKIGDNVGATGSATVTGAGSAWTAEQLLRVGANGDGSLTVGAGGTLSSQGAELARQPGSSASVTLTGAGSTWTDSVDVAVGVRGPATLLVEAGAALHAATARLGVEADGSGEIVVAGASWPDAVELSIGLLGSGALTVQDGGSVTTLDPATGTIVAGQPGSVSAITVTGAGSALATAGTLEVGALGDGDLEVGAGGHVQSPVAIIGKEPGSVGSAIVAGTGASWDVAGNLFVGNMGSGSLEVRDGAALTCAGLCRIGDEADGDGGVLVTGANASLACDAQLFVGNFGSGSLDVTAGGAVSTTRAKIGDETGSTGTAIVTGTGSSWTTTNDLVVGNFGAGTLTIADGATVGAATVMIADDAGASGDVTVDDATLACTGAVRVGDLGAGTLFIEGGGSVEAGAVTIGLGAGSSGLLRLRGAGSSVSCAGGLDIGPGGPGRLRLVRHGTVACGSLTQHAGGALELVLGPSSADMVTAGGVVSLDGSIDVSLVAGYEPAPGTSVTIIEGTAINGTFASQALPPGLRLVYEATRVRVVAEGGGGEDSDGDGVPDSEDVCPGGDDTVDGDGDGVPDFCDNCPDVPNGDQADGDGDGTGDACECVADVDGNGFVDVDDLVAVILAWGTGDAAADVNADGTVNVDDLVSVILAWGTC